MSKVKWIITVLATALLLTAELGIFNYIIDPLQIYRKSTFFSPWDNQRYANPCIARYYDYDTIIMGSSMTENFLPSQIYPVLHVHSIKLSISGTRHMRKACCSVPQSGWAR